jgi:hypothetical protein
MVIWWQKYAIITSKSYYLLMPLHALVYVLYNGHVKKTVNHGEKKSTNDPCFYWKFINIRKRLNPSKFRNYDVLIWHEIR